MQSRAFETSVRTTRKTPLLSQRFFHFSTITKRQCCALNHCLKPHWNFDKNHSNYSLICCCISPLYIIDIFEKNTDRPVVILILFILFFIHWDNFFRFYIIGEKPFSKHSLKFLVKEPLKYVTKFLDNSRVVCGWILNLFQNLMVYITAKDICSLLAFLKVKVEFNSIHSFLIASILGWSLYFIVSLWRL